MGALRERLDAAQQHMRGAEAAACDEQVRARELQLGCSHQMRELELRVQEAIRQAQAADSGRQQLQAAQTAAEVSRTRGLARLVVLQAQGWWA